MGETKGGPRWSLGKKLYETATWPEIKRITQSSDDSSIRMDIGRTWEKHLPFHFLANESARKEFAAEVLHLRLSVCASTRNYNAETTD